MTTTLLLGAYIIIALAFIPFMAARVSKQFYGYKSYFDTAFIGMIAIVMAAAWLFISLLWLIGAGGVYLEKRAKARV